MYIRCRLDYLYYITYMYISSHNHCQDERATKFVRNRG